MLNRLRLPLAALLIAVIAATAATKPAERFHTRLVKSLPSKDTVLTASPEKLELWFSEKIDLVQSRVQLMGPNNKVIPIAPIRRDDSKPDQPVVSTLVTDLEPGTYTVNWSAASGDGHPVRGAFQFTMKTP